MKNLFQVLAIGRTNFENRTKIIDQNPPRLNGNLIVGGAGSGKTSQIALQTRCHFDENPHTRVLAAGGADFLAQLPPRIQQSENFVFIETGIPAIAGAEYEGTEVVLMQALLRLRTAEVPLLVALDDPYLLFSQCSLKNTALPAHLLHTEAVAPGKLTLLVAGRSFDSLASLFGIELIAAFSDYTILHDRAVSDNALEFCRRFDINPRDIPPGGAYHFRRQTGADQPVFHLVEFETA